MSTLVLGLGNFLLRDEGVGIHAIRALQQETWPAHVTLFDGGTAGMELYTSVTDAERVVILDAVITGAPPASLVILRDEEVPAQFSRKVSLHQNNLADVLAAAKLAGRVPPKLALVGIVPLELSTGVELSPAVAARLPEMLSSARALALG